MDIALPFSLEIDWIWCLRLLRATGTTIGLAILAGSVGLVLSVLWALLEQGGPRIIRWGLFLFLSAIRGLPEILILLWVSYCIGPYCQWSAWPLAYGSFDSWVAAIVALSLLFSSYACQVWVSSFQAIPPGQTDAAWALGIGRYGLFKDIIFPQSWQLAKPGLTNLWLVLIKDTALVSLLGITDVMQVARISAAGGSSHHPFVFLLIAAGIYLAITSFFQRVIGVPDRAIT